MSSVKADNRVQGEAVIEAWNEANLPWEDFKQACIDAVKSWPSKPDFTEVPGAVKRMYEGVSVTVEGADGQYRITQAQGGSLVSELRGKIIIGTLTAKVF